MIINDTESGATLEISAIGFAVTYDIYPDTVYDTFWLDFLVRYTAPDGSVEQGIDSGIEISCGDAATLCAFFANAAALAVGESKFCVLLDNTILLTAERRGPETWLLDAEARYFDYGSMYSFRAVQTDVTLRQLMRMADEWAYVQWKYSYPDLESGWIPAIDERGGSTRTTVRPPVPSGEEAAARRFDEAEFARFRRFYRWRISPDGDFTVTP